MAISAIPVNFLNENDFKAQTMSVEIKTPKIKENIRDKSCIIFFPKMNIRLNRIEVANIMKDKWGELFDHVVHFGNVDFSKKWIFCFDSHENNERAIEKQIYINDSRIMAYHATKKFNTLKIDWVPRSQVLVYGILK